jgi:integrase
VDWLDWADVHRLLDAVPEERFKLAAAWLFLSGWRVGEAVRARQEDVQLIKETDLYRWHVPNTKTHIRRDVWLPEELATRLEATRATNRPRPDWPILWDSAGRGFGRTEDPAAPISAKAINCALDRAADRLGLTIRVTAHVGRHSYCSNWIHDRGDSERQVMQLSYQVGSSVARSGPNLRPRAVHRRRLAAPLSLRRSAFNLLRPPAKAEADPPSISAGRGLTFESCRAHGFTKLFSRGRNCEKRTH